MKITQVENPDDFDTLEGKLRALRGSLDGLLDGTETFRLRHDITVLLASNTASLIILHQVLEAMLEEQIQEAK